MLKEGWGRTLHNDWMLLMNQYCEHCTWEAHICNSVWLCMCCSMARSEEFEVHQRVCTIDSPGGPTRSRADGPPALGKSLSPPSSAQGVINGTPKQRECYLCGDILDRKRWLGLITGDNLLVLYIIGLAFAACPRPTSSFHSIKLCMNSPAPQDLGFCPWQHLCSKIPNLMIVENICGICD